MNQRDLLAEEFEENRVHLRTVAYRMLGSLSEAEDAVQEAWFRLNRSDSSGIGNLGGWLTTVVARVCLDMLRSRQSRREEPLDSLAPEPLLIRANGTDPEREALLADSVGLALLVVLEALPPTERIAFVLRDMFDVPFEEIAPMVGRSLTAARQLASRARRRVRGAATATGADPIPSSNRVPASLSNGSVRNAGGTRDPCYQREIVHAFMAASRGGDFAALIALLDPDVVLRALLAGCRVSYSPSGSGEADSSRSTSSPTPRGVAELRVHSL